MRVLGLALHYLSPALLNGSLWLLVRLKERRSHYTQIAEGLGFVLWVGLAGLLLNTLAGWLEWRHGYPIPGTVHLALVLFSVAYYLWFRLK